MTLINDYKKGALVKELSKKYNICIKTVYNILHKNKIKLRIRGVDAQIYTVNSDYFENIDSEDKAYWLGFIFGDGCIRDNTMLRLELNKKDINHLFKFKKNIKSNHKITKTAKNCYIIRISRKKICKDLFKYGIIKNKTYVTKKMPLENIPNELQKHFIRGYIDADGCIAIHGINKSTKRKTYCYKIACHQKSICLQLIKWFKNIGTSGGFITKAKNGCYSFNLTGNNNFIIAAKTIYKNSTIFLDRKYQKSITYLNYLEG